MLQINFQLNLLLLLVNNCAFFCQLGYPIKIFRGHFLAARKNIRVIFMKHVLLFRLYLHLPPFNVFYQQLQITFDL